MWRRRRHQAAHGARAGNDTWADLLPATSDEVSARMAALAEELRAEAQQLAEVLGEPTVMLGTIRVPAWLAQHGDDEW